MIAKKNVEKIESKANIPEAKPNLTKNKTVSKVKSSLQTDVKSKTTPSRSSPAKPVFKVAKLSASDKRKSQGDQTKFLKETTTWNEKAFNQLF